MTLDAKVASYSANLKKAYETAKFGDDPARAREDFEDVLKLVSAEYRPVLVIDDTEHFVRQGEDGVDADSVRNLFHNGIRALAELERIDLVIASHPRYDEVEAVGEVTSRFGFRRVDVATLSPESENPGLGSILQRRLDRHGVDANVAEVIAADVVSQLETVYFLREHDLRQVLDLAAQAAGVAAAEDAQQIERRHLQPLLDGLH